MRTAFVGFKKIGGFCTAGDAERDYRNELALLDAHGVAYTTQELGDDQTVIYVIETYCSFCEETVCCSDAPGAESS